jgi:hypothetical protein
MKSSTGLELKASLKGLASKVYPKVKRLKLGTKLKRVKQSNVTATVQAAARRPKKLRLKNISRLKGIRMIPANMRTLGMCSVLLPDRYANGDIKPVTWDNFDKGAWPEDVTRLPVYNYLMERKRRSEESLRAAQLASSTHHSKQEPYTFWETYFEADVNIHRGLDEFHKVTASIDALVRVLGTHPFYGFGRHHQRLAMTNIAFQKETKDLRKIRWLLGQSQTTPLHVNSQLHKDSFSRDVEKLVEHLRATGKLQKNLAKEEGEEIQKGIRSNSKHSTNNNAAKTLGLSQLNALFNTDAEALESDFNKQPELWAIEPIWSALRQMTFRRLPFGPVFKKSSYPIASRRQEIEATLSSLTVVVGQTTRLANELSALQFYRLRRHPGSMLGPQVELGKQLWRKVQERKKDTVLPWFIHAITRK